MALLNAGTKLTTSLKMLQWQPAGMNQTDLAALIALMRNPLTGGYGASSAIARGFIENGKLYLPGTKGNDDGGITLEPGDWIGVDGAGWPVVIPNAIFATSWQHS